MSRAEAERLLAEQPPFSPGSEPLADPNHPVAQQCQDDASLMEGDQILRTRVTATERWGIIWRADVAKLGEPDLVFRQVCYGQDSIRGILITPLEMFDPSDNTPPLPDQ